MSLLSTVSDRRNNRATQPREPAGQTEGDTAVRVCDWCQGREDVRKCNVFVTVDYTTPPERILDDFVDLCIGCRGNVTIANFRPANRPGVKEEAVEGSKDA